MSFKKKKGWNGILSKFKGAPKGLCDPELCKKEIWIITKNRMIKGKIKWKEKKTW